MKSSYRSDKPLSRVEASKCVSFPLPKSARDVYFVSHADGMQEFEEYVRFKVDPSEMGPTVDALLAGHSSSPPAYEPGAEKSFQPMDWWTPNLIAHGSHYTADNQPIYIWTDIDNQTIFVYRSD